ncbi:MAG TPA: right-handed parallel beta-helix repeat-containing protein, partial [Acidimicrobiales bacterium]|nr:right-handed parallel beta-helix repeat-containing protein [Acidimicrobiales bacterium]
MFLSTDPVGRGPYATARPTVKQGEPMNHQRVRKLLRPLAGSAMVMTGLTAMAVTAPPASAAHLSCGSMVMASSKLAQDIGPCAGDGLIVMGSNIVLNLNGFRVSATNGAGDNAGIRVVAGMDGVAPTGNVVRNGIVEGFDAGVVIIGGGGNTVTGVRAQNNVNDLQSLGEPAPGVCDLGEGILLQNSSDNMITRNEVRNNGPFGGITVILDSDRNQIRNNFVKNNNIQGLPAVPGGRAGCGNSNQDEGIRIEGPGSNDNIVQENIVEGSLLAGIGMHGFVCGDPAANTAPNTGTIVRGNTVSGTANPTATAPPGNSQSNGISILQQGPAGIVCPAFNNTIKDNVSQNNAGHGIFVPTNSADNTVSGNRVVRNGN